MKIYVSPTVDVKVLHNSAMLCASGEQYNLPQGIGLPTYGTDTSDDNDW